ncbi:hypothetical protein M413DRAFT_12189 [Hebeloma cylindrosporum]|uniref:Uncharacterized protein n=1 Tax=Hebeloma cylindrosporum TaxID=76867 RepID=A0A0C2XPX8_HEBCY|nr:hypothetical protein M413DRAFT_12189 [Hebeloma cylindrosporum h7]
MKRGPVCLEFLFFLPLLLILFKVQEIKMWGEFGTNPECRVTWPLGCSVPTEDRHSPCTRHGYTYNGYGWTIINVIFKLNTISDHLTSGGPTNADSSLRGAVIAPSGRRLLQGGRE